MAVGRHREKGQWVWLDTDGKKDNVALLHELTHISQPADSSKEINPFWNNLTHEVWAEYKKEYSDDIKGQNRGIKYLTYVFREEEMPAWMAEAKAQYYLLTNKSFKPETVTFEDIGEMFETLSKYDEEKYKSKRSAYSIWNLMFKAFPENDYYRKAIKDIFNSVAVVIPDTNERIA
jgi:hypothetical protein